MKNGVGERANCMGDSSIVMHYAILTVDPAGSIASCVGVVAGMIASPLQYSTLLGREGRVFLQCCSLSTGRRSCACVGVGTQSLSLVASLVGSGRV